MSANGGNWGDTLSSALVAQPWLFAAAVVLALAIIAVVSLRVRVRLHKPSDPLEGLFQSESFDNRSADASRDKPVGRQASHRSGAVLHGRIDHFTQVGQVWGTETRNDAIDEVARVLRAGVRRTDAVWPAGEGADSDMVGGTDGEASSPGGIIIHAHGASEEEASGIAQRLLKRLADTPVPGIGDDIRLTASFGVAERREGEDATSLYARASAALFAAQAAGEEGIVSASEWEEVRMLPAPAPTETSGKDAEEPEANRAA